MKADAPKLTNVQDVDKMKSFNADFSLYVDFKSTGMTILNLHDNQFNYFLIFTKNLT